MEQQKKILNSLFDEELQDHSKLGGDEKAEISQVKYLINIIIEIIKRFHNNQQKILTNY